LIPSSASVIGGQGGRHEGASYWQQADYARHIWSPRDWTIAVNFAARSPRRRILNRSRTMRRRPALLATLLVLSTVAIAHLPGNAGDDSPPEELVVVVYPVSDLPVWKYSEPIKWETDENSHSRPTQDRPDGETKFDPSLLITFIKSSIDPESWKEGGLIAPHEKTAAIVIRATDSNHQLIGDLLEKMRAADQRKQAQAKGDVKKLTLSQPETVTPPSPLMEQLKAMPYEQRVHIPIDMKVLTRPPIR
jgi:hypothetical protein